MSISNSLTTDAPLSEVIAVLAKAGLAEKLVSDEDDENVYRFTVPNGAYVTASEDLKLYEDELETWLDIHEYGYGSQLRLFEVLTAEFSERVTRFAIDSADVIEERPALNVLGAA